MRYLLSEGKQKAAYIESAHSTQLNALSYVFIVFNIRNGGRSPHSTTCRAWTELAGAIDIINNSTQLYLTPLSDTNLLLELRTNHSYTNNPKQVMPVPDLPEPAHADTDSMLSRKFGKEVANYFSGKLIHT